MGVALNTKNRPSLRGRDKIFEIDQPEGGGQDSDGGPRATVEGKSGQLVLGWEEARLLERN